MRPAHVREDPPGSGQDAGAAMSSADWRGKPAGAYRAGAGLAGLAHLQLRLEDHLPVLVPLVAQRLLQQQLGRHPAQLLAGLADR